MRVYPTVVKEISSDSRDMGTCMVNFVVAKSSCDVFKVQFNEGRVLPFYIDSILVNRSAYMVIYTK